MIPQSLEKRTVIPAQFVGRGKFCCVVVAIGTLLAGCSRQEGAQGPGGGRGGAGGPVPVTVATSFQTNVPVQVQGIGHVNAFSTVSVVAQVDGQLAKVLFQQGDELKEGQLIFQIDAAPFDANVRQAEAVLARDVALAKKAEGDVRRSTELFEKKIESAEVHELTIATAESIKATVQADQAALENAKLLRAYCDIRSPITGRAGKLLVTAGNIVKRQDTTLLVINQLRPIYVDFSIPESQLPEIRKYMGAGKLKVEAVAPGHEHPSRGELLLINNLVDTNTGNVSLRASFPNDDESLWPGQFVEATLTLTTQSKVVVPSSAVQNSQSGQFVFVVKPGETVEKPDMMVENRPVVAGAKVGDNVAIEKGLQTDEQVVTSGQLKLISGSKVVIGKPADAPRKSGASNH